MVAYMCDHSEEILLVADSLDEADVDKLSLLWRILCGKCQDLPRLHVIIWLTPLRENAVAVQALPPQSTIGGRWLHRREDRAVRRRILHSKPPKGS